MFSRLFPCCNRAPQYAADDDRALIADIEQGQADIAAERNAGVGCNSSKFWIGSEFVYNFAKVLTLSTYALATQITDVAKMQSDYESVELANNALYISLPIAVLFALSEAACHYAESTLISNTADNANAIDDNAPRASLTKSQMCLVAAHLLSDVYTDVGGYLAVAEIVGLKQQTDAVRYSIYAGLTVFSAWGCMQEARNAAESFKDMNTAANNRARV